MTLRTALLASVTMLALAGCSETDDGDKADDTGTTDGDTDAPVDEDGDGSPAGEDCDDSDPAVFPGADEVCDGVDNDCDDLVDAEDDSVTDLGTFYADADGDSYGDLESPVEACEASAGVVEDSSDCDDANSEINPAAEEVCDAVDNDCDGVINGPDATDATDWYPDVDTDGFGDSTATPTRECDAPSGTVADNTDCDDGAIDVNPGATEVWYDGVDGDCSGGSDYDADGDGEDRIDETAGTGTDCDDGDATINTAATDTWYDGVDSDCSGGSDYDADGDGYDSEDYDGLDCDDTDAAVNPDAVDVWYDGVDDDCSGGSDYDADGDGWDSDLYSGADCDDGDAEVYPYNLELSTDTDGLDNDCDGSIDAADTNASMMAVSSRDDDIEEVSFSGFSFPFCGSVFTSTNVDTNGRIVFDFGTDSSGAAISPSSDYSESAGELSGVSSSSWSENIGVGSAIIAPFWDDMNPSDTDSTGGIYYVENSDSVGFYWWDVVPYSGGATDQQRFSVVLFDDGSFMVNHNIVTETDGAVGFGCGPGSYIDENDLSTAEANAGAIGLGDGSEDLFFEVWEYTVAGGSSTYDSTDTFDLSGWTAFCGVGGTDADADGFTEECGDPDDTDPAVTP